MMTGFCQHDVRLLRALKFVRRVSKQHLCCMTKIMHNKSFHVDKVAMAIIACILVAIAIIVSVWMYYVNEIDKISSKINKEQVDVNTNKH